MIFKKSKGGGINREKKRFKRRLAGGQATLEGDEWRIFEMEKKRRRKKKLYIG